MDWMESTPVNYIGIEDDYDQVKAGRWFFSQADGEVVYRVIHANMIEIASEEESEYVRFRVVLDYLDNNGNQRFDEPEERLIGLRLQPLHFYKWMAIESKVSDYDTK